MKGGTLKHVFPSISRVNDKRKRYRLPSGFIPPTPLYKHQAVGIATLARKKDFALFDDCGLGKTLQAIYAFEEMRNSNIVDTCVVVCPKSAIQTWREEIELHTGCRNVNIISGIGKEQRAQFYIKGATYYLLNYDLLSKSSCEGAFSYEGLHLSSGYDAKLLMCLLRYTNSLLILDECHRIKSISSNTTRALVSLSRYAKARIILTGTPLADRPEDLYAPLLFLNKADLLGGAYYSFIQRYTIRAGIRLANGRTFKKIVGYRNIDELHKQISLVSLQRSKDKCLDLPPKIYMRRYAMPDAPFIKWVQRFRDDLIDAIKHNGNLVTISDYMRRLHLAENLPELYGCSIKSPKLELLESCLTDNPGTRIIWVWNRAVAEFLKSFLKNDAEFIHGGVDDATRQTHLRSWMNGKYPYLIATLGTISESVTLTHSSIATYYQLYYRPLLLRQSENRIHRIGTVNTCRIEYLYLKGCIDHYADLVSQYKQSVIDAVQFDPARPIMDRAKLLEVMNMPLAP